MQHPSLETILPTNLHGASTFYRPIAEAFAGLHNAGRRVVVIFDEASAIDPIIFETVEPIATDANTQVIWCCFGNPLRNYR
jgi:hypothetical protein